MKSFLIRYLHVFDMDSTQLMGQGNVLILQVATSYVSKYQAQNEFTTTLEQVFWIWIRNLGI